MTAAVLAVPPGLQPLLGEVTRQVRWRRAERGAWRGAFWGGLFATGLLLGKGALDDWALPLAGTAWLCAIAVCALLAAMRPVAPLTAARLADRELGLADRIASSLELKDKGLSDPLAQSQISDTLDRVATLGAQEKRRYLQRVTPREAKFVGVCVAIAVLLAMAPPVPGPEAWLQQWKADRARDDRSSLSLLDKLKVLGGNLLHQPQANGQEQMQAKQADARAAAEAAEFKDRTAAKAKQDFDSFVKKGDERLRLLERTDRLPDLQSDFASSKYRMMMQKTQELSAGKGPGQVSASKLAQILKEMERLGRKGGEWSDDVSEAMDALQQGQMDEAMDAMQNALGKMKQAEDAQRASKSLRGGKDDTVQGREAAGSAEGSNLAFNDPDRRGGYSSAKGGPSKGAPTARLRSTPYDSGIQGQRSGRAPSYETQNTGRPGASGLQLQYLGEVGQYRRLMEDTIAREQVPRDYHTQIRDYFKSLGDQ